MAIATSMVKARGVREFRYLHTRFQYLVLVPQGEIIDEMSFGFFRVSCQWRQSPI